MGLIKEPKDIDLSTKSERWTEQELSDFRKIMEEIKASKLFLNYICISRKIMTTAAIRKRLHGYIDVADDKQIKNIFALFEDQMAPKANWWQDKEFVAELDERVRRYEEGIDKGHSWEEVEASITEMKKKRAEK